MRNPFAFNMAVLLGSEWYHIIALGPLVRITVFDGGPILTRSLLVLGMAPAQAARAITRVNRLAGMGFSALPSFPSNADAGCLP